MFGGAQPSAFSAVVFDLNDTLVHGGERELRDAFSRGAARDLGVDQEAFAAAVRESFDARCRGALGDLYETYSRLAHGLGVRPDPAAVRSAVERRLCFERGRLVAAPRVLEALDRLRRAGYRLGLISDCSAETPAIWRETALAERFEVAVFSWETGARKPDPSLYLAAARGLGVAPGDCLYVGDGGSDELAGAERAGMSALRLEFEEDDPVTQADRRELYGVRPWDGPAIADIAELVSLLGPRAPRPAADAVAGPRAAAVEGGPLPPSTGTSVVGRAAQYIDPVWRVPVSLSPVERELLRTEPLRRLHMVAHGGAASITTTQTYTRLEHSLGVLALVAHFHPDDQVLRAAALLHDLGHLPFSHTFEGIAGLNHHALGLDLLREPAIEGALAAHGLDGQDVADLLSGRTPSALTPAPGLLGLDHLDSYVRSARFGARLDVEPARLLAAAQLVDGVVSTDRQTAQALVDLVCAEARLHVSWDNVAPSAALQRLVKRLLEAGREEPGRLARMTDAQLWTALHAAPETRAEAEMLRTRPHLLRVRPADGRDEQDEQGERNAWDFALRKIYSSAPLIDALPVEAAAPALAEQLADLQALPTGYRVWWNGEIR